MDNNIFKMEDALCGCCSAKVDSNLVHCKGWLKKHKLPGDVTVFKKMPDGSYLAETVYIKEIIFRNPATIIIWSDGKKTVAVANGNDVYNPEAGVVLCILKRTLGPTATRDMLKAWVPEGDYTKPVVRTLKDVRKDAKENK